jgi:hypothetical protein
MRGKGKPVSLSIARAAGAITLFLPSGVATMRRRMGIKIDRVAFSILPQQWVHGCRSLLKSSIRLFENIQTVNAWMRRADCLGRWLSSGMETFAVSVRGGI